MQTYYLRSRCCCTDVPHDLISYISWIGIFKKYLLNFHFQFTTEKYTFWAFYSASGLSKLYQKIRYE